MEEKNLNLWEKAAHDAWEAILTEVKKLKDDQKWTYEKIGQFMGAKTSTIHAWLNGQRKAENTDFASLMNYLDRLNLSFLDYFPSERIAEIKRIEKNAPVEQFSQIDSSLRKILIYNVAGAGNAIEITEADPIETFYVPYRYSHCDYAVLIDGHSMEPTISNGAICGIQKDFYFVADEIYLAYIPYEGRIVKRIGIDHSKNEMVFRSDNPDKCSYPSFSLPLTETQNAILGRVVWIMTIKNC